MKFGVRSAVVTLALAAATVAGAVTEPADGPRRVEVLGYDASDQRLWVHELQRWNAESFGDICYFDLGGDKPTLKHRVNWNAPGEGSRTDPALAQKLGELRSRLQPLTRVTLRHRPTRSSIVSRDILHATAYNVAREHVRVAFEAGPQFEIVTYGNPDVDRPAVYSVPGRAEKLFVLAYHDDPEDRESVSHVPVVVLKDETGVRKVEVGKAAWKD